MLGLSWVIGWTVLCLISMIGLTAVILQPMYHSKRRLVCLAALLLLVVASSASAVESVLEKAQPYKSYLRQTAIQVWGVEAPIMLFAGQIHQESLWNPNARSAYACGLTQFTPDTAKWIAEQYSVDVGKGECTDARWAIRAMLRYDKYLYEKLGGKDVCSTLRFSLSGYNGGAGWVNRDRAKALAAGKNPKDYDQVAPFNAGRGEEFFRENRQYPPKIITHQKVYSEWGGPFTCKTEEKLNGTKRSEVLVSDPRCYDPWRCSGVDRWLCRMVKAC